MNEKKEAGLNEPDMQAVIVAWIIANDGCGGVANGLSCLGQEGRNKGTRCPLFGSWCGTEENVVKNAKKWLLEHLQPEPEAIKEPAPESELEKSCGSCQHTSVNRLFGSIKLAWCSKGRVPVGFSNCPDFEPKTSEPCKLSACAPSLEVERITRLEKKNAELQKTNAHLQEELAWQLKKMGQRIKDLEQELSMRNLFPRPNFFS